MTYKNFSSNFVEKKNKKEQFTKKNIFEKPFRQKTTNFKIFSGKKLIQKKK